MKTKILYSNIHIPVSINTDERIFELETYDNEIVLCNLSTAQMLINSDVCKGIKHYWNNKFTRIGKDEVKEMPL